MPHPIISQNSAITALMNMSFKNTANALAELLDNSIDATGGDIELICHETSVMRKQKKMEQISEIAVFDDGKGMEPALLEMCLGVGDGTHLKPELREKFGRFGLGLSMSSMTQAHLVEIYSWQGGVENTHYVKLDVNEVQSGAQKELIVQKKPFPDKYKNIVRKIEDSGTLVIWSNLSNPTWARGESTLKNAASIIGSMYRSFLDEGSLTIRMVNITSNKKMSEFICKPNDPLYLMKNSQTPAPWSDRAMFELLREDDYPVKFNDKTYSIKIKSSFSLKEARAGDSAGNTPHGQHAKNNMGISLLREGREINLVTTLCSSSDPTERWWGLEVNIPHELDDLFEITPDKSNYRALESTMISSVRRSGKKSEKEDLDMFDEDDGRTQIFKLVDQLQLTIDELRRRVKKAAGAKTKGGKKRGITPPEKPATEKTKDRPEGGSDKPEKTIPLSERLKFYIEHLIEKGYTPEDAKELASFLEEEKLKYSTTVKDMATPDFFLTEEVKGFLEVTLNINHKAWSLLELIAREDEIETMSEEELRIRAYKTVTGIKLILYAWARLRDESKQDDRKKLDQYRTQWAIIAEDFFPDE